MIENLSCVEGFRTCLYCLLPILWNIKLKSGSVCTDKVTESNEDKPKPSASVDVDKDG
jgi:hypothetical protein